MLYNHLQQHAQNRLELIEYVYNWFLIKAREFTQKPVRWTAKRG